MRQQGTLLAGLLLLGALVLGVCGIPISRSAEPSPAGNLPPQLSGSTSTPTTTTTTTTTPIAGKHTSNLDVYLVAPTGHLVAVHRPAVEQHVTPFVALVSAALEVLVVGPNPADAKQGITTYMPPAPHFGVSVAHGIASVTLDEASFGFLFGSSLSTPLAQIVYTLLADFPTLKGVNFYLGGELYNYTPSGSTSPKPVTDQTYSSLAPLSTHSH